MLMFVGQNTADVVASTLFLLLVAAKTTLIEFRKELDLQL